MSIIKKLNKVLGAVCDSYSDAWLNDSNSKSSSTSSSSSSGVKYDFMKVPNWKCCANCRNFSANYNMSHYTCLRHMRFFTLSEIEHEKMHHKTICDSYFQR